MKNIITTTKRLFCFFLMFSLLIGFIPTSNTYAISWDGSCRAGDHDPYQDYWYDQFSVMDPDCTSPGYWSYTCKYCGLEKQITTEPALGHSYGDWSENIAATCTQNGSASRYCVRCGQAETQATPALGHNYGSWTTVKKATCTEDGREERTCSRCYQTESQTVNSTGHEKGEWETETEATENSAGKKVVKCKTCQKVLEEETTYPDSAILPTSGGFPVMILQALLKSASRYTGPVDGVYSDAVKTALESYQKDNGFEVTGIGFENVLTKLTADYVSGISDIDVNMTIGIWESGLEAKTADESTYQSKNDGTHDRQSVITGVTFSLDSESRTISLGSSSQISLDNKTEYCSTGNILATCIHCGYRKPLNIGTGITPLISFDVAILNAIEENGMTPVEITDIDKYSDKVFWNPFEGASKYIVSLSTIDGEGSTIIHQYEPTTDTSLSLAAVLKNTQIEYSSYFLVEVIAYDGNDTQISLPGSATFQYTKKLPTPYGITYDNGILTALTESDVPEYEPIYFTIHAGSKKAVLYTYPKNGIASIDLKEESKQQYYIEAYSDLFNESSSFTVDVYQAQLWEHAPYMSSETTTAGPFYYTDLGYKKTRRDVSVLSGPDFSFPEITKISKDSIVQVLDYKNDFELIRYNDITGWIYATMLGPVNESNYTITVNPCNGDDPWYVMTNPDGTTSFDLDNHPVNNPGQICTGLYLFETGGEELTDLYVFTADTEVFMQWAPDPDLFSVNLYDLEKNFYKTIYATNEGGILQEPLPLTCQGTPVKWKLRKDIIYDPAIQTSVKKEMEGFQTELYAVLDTDSRVTSYERPLYKTLEPEPEEIGTLPNKTRVTIIDETEYDDEIYYYIVSLAEGNDKKYEGWVSEEAFANSRYTVFLDSNGGYCSVKSLVSKRRGGFNTAVLPIPQKDDCIFLGWYCEETQKRYTPDSGEITLAQNTILVADWTDIECSTVGIVVGSTSKDRFWREKAGDKLQNPQAIPNGSLVYVLKKGGDSLAYLDDGTDFIAKEDGSTGYLNRNNICTTFYKLSGKNKTLSVYNTPGDKKFIDKLYFGSGGYVYVYGEEFYKDRTYYKVVYNTNIIDSLNATDFGTGWVEDSSPYRDKTFILHPGMGNVDICTITNLKDLPTPECEYQFTGWYTEPDFGEKVDRYSYAFDLPTNLYAHYEDEGSWHYYIVTSDSGAQCYTPSMNKCLQKPYPKGTVLYCQMIPGPYYKIDDDDIHTYYVDRTAISFAHRGYIKKGGTYLYTERRKTKDSQSIWLEENTVVVVLASAPKAGYYTVAAKMFDRGYTMLYVPEDAVAFE